MAELENPDAPRKKGWRRLIPIFIIILIITVLFTAQSIMSGSPQFRYSPWYNSILSLAILNINIILILVLVIVIFRHLVKLFSERKRKILGSRFRTKLVLTMISVILVPTGLVYILSSDLISKSVDRWYEDTVEKIVRSAENLSTRYLDPYQDLLTEQTGKIATDIQRENFLSDDKVFYLQQQYLEPLMDELHFDVVEIYRGRERFGVTVIDPESPLLPYLDDPAVDYINETLALSRDGEKKSVIWSEDYPAGTLVRCAVPIFEASEDSPETEAIGVVVMGFGVSTDLSALASAISSDYASHREQVDSRDFVKLTWQGLLLIFTLISLFSAIWIGIYFSRGITVPIQQLAEGTKAVASGNLDYRVDSTSSDELGILVASFNEMTHDLKESKEELEEANRNLISTNFELERRRRYTETLLSNLSAAVISLDDDGNVSTVNAPVEYLLGMQIEEAVGNHWKSVFSREDLAPLLDLIERFFNLDVQGITEQVNLRLDKQLLHLSVTVTNIRHVDGSMRGTLIVLDDLTQLVRAQRTAAWQEVAQRIAHEIKNPLTPIQLSAERIRRKMLLSDNGDESENGDNGDNDQFDLISTCTNTIIEETGTLKSMVDAFSSFARIPQVQLLRGEVNSVLEKATSIYTSDDDGSGFSISKDFDEDVPPIELDPEQLKMAFVNIINNAIDAMEGQGKLHVLSHYDKKRMAVIIDFIDNGPGIPPETKDKLFMPYFSTKKKGTGLGLAIVSRIISDHHGSITVSDNQPNGARFTITLPTV